MASDRSISLAREFNLSEGFTKEDDRLPKRFYEPLEFGPRKGARISEIDLNEAISIYYGMMGWDKTGKPETVKLQELSLF
jgi:aldehyde:ferredoxin oxidoreductase